MKKLLTAAFAALAITNPAQANDFTQADLQATKGILQTIEQVGVRLVNSKICPEGMVGRYSYKNMTMTLCPLAYSRGTAYLSEVITHEAVHVAQHCNEAPLSANIKPHNLPNWKGAIAAGLRGKWEHVNEAVEGLNEEDTLAEYEAYGFENYPQAVLVMLKKVCL